MNIVNKLTVRHLKENKKRTFVTIIGTIISVAMITAVATLAISFLDLMQRQTIEQNGEWHVQYLNVDANQLQAIQEDKETKDVIVSRDIGYAWLEGSENNFKPYLFFREYSTAGFEQFPITLAKGRFPTAADELLISEHILTNGGVEFRIGEEITVPIGDRYNTNPDVVSEPLIQQYSLMLEDGEIAEEIRDTVEKTFTVVGIMERPNWERPWSPGYTVLSYLDDSSIAEGEKVDATVVVKNVNRNLYDHAEALATENGISLESVVYHNELLRYSGVMQNDGLRSTLFNLAAIIIIIIIVGSVALIYNAFAISVTERARHLGMLASVGATKRQKRNSVFFEGIIIALISIPIGILAGIGGIAITFTFLNTFIEDALGVSQTLMVKVSLGSVMVACLVSALTIFISTYLPARKASKITAIEAIRQTQDIKLTGKKVKTSKLVRLLFGMEGELGLKNLKRNKRKYQITVFSLVISIILFLSVTYFTYSIEKSVALSTQGLDYDIQVHTTSIPSESDLLIFEAMTQLDGVTESSFIQETQLLSPLDKSRVQGTLKDMVERNPDLIVDGKYGFMINVHGMDEQSFEEFAETIGLDADVFHETNDLPAIVIDTITYHDWEANKRVETKQVDISVGESLPLYFKEWEKSEEYRLLKDVEIVAVTDELPMGVSTQGLGIITVIVPQWVLSELAEEEEHFAMWTALYLSSEDPMATQYGIEEIKEYYMHLYNMYQTRQRDEQMMLFVSVFVYGFITLISFISIANIFNTISTSISLRKREFAMLKSVGMTAKSFRKMINYESIFYGLKALLYGLPISFGIMYVMHRALMNSFSYTFTVPWTNIAIVVLAVFFIVGSAMLYSTSKVRKENIIETLKQENI